MHPSIGRSLFRSKMTWPYLAVSTGHWKMGLVGWRELWARRQMIGLNYNFHLVVVWFRVYLNGSKPWFPLFFFFVKQDNDQLEKYFFTLKKSSSIVFRFVWGNVQKYAILVIKCLPMGHFIPPPITKGWIMLLQSIIIDNIMMKQYFI